MNAAESQPPPLLDVKIYYETLCPYSIMFIRDKFYDAMIEKKLFNYTDFSFIPYGNVKITWDCKTGQRLYKCQHGAEECDLNALHACIVENNSKLEQLELIHCLFGGETVENCANDLNINVTNALECKKRSIDDILKKYEQETDAAQKRYVPWITVDGIFDEDNDEDFVGVFYEKYKEKYNVTLAN